MARERTRIELTGFLASFIAAKSFMSARNTVVLATSDIATDLGRSIAELEHAGFHVLMLLATNQTRRAPRNALVLTPGCDLAESFGLGEQGTELMRAMTPRFSCS